MKLTMNRQGEFHAHWSDPHNKCGAGHDITPKYSYHCHIETANILDPHGFVFDQLKIDEYFVKKYSGYQNAKSCENIAVTACQDVKRMIENHMLSHNGMSVIYRIAVTISVRDGAAQMTAEWTPEATKQIANVKRKKTDSEIVRDIETTSIDNKKTMPISNLEKNLREASERVANWPEWKRNRRLP